MANVRISDIGGGRFVVEKRGEEIDVHKTADSMLVLAKSGAYRAGRSSSACRSSPIWSARRTSRMPRSSTARSRKVAGAAFRAAPRSCVRCRNCRR